LNSRSSETVTISPVPETGISEPIDKMNVLTPTIVSEKQEADDATISEPIDKVDDLPPTIASEKQEADDTTSPIIPPTSSETTQTFDANSTKTCSSKASSIEEFLSAEEKSDPEINETVFEPPVTEK
jgi:hypothetical protein